MISVLSAIISTTILITFIARGYIPRYNNGIKIISTGILSTTSIPKNANVIINDKLYTTTDNSINLVPGNYQLQITKSGYLPWNKTVTIQKEMVTQANASLFKTNPKLLPITTSVSLAPTANTDLSQIVYIAPSSSNSVKPGIYLIESTYYLPSVINKYQSKYITSNPFTSTDDTISFVFSPNSKQLILTSAMKHTSYLINLTGNELTQNPIEINLPNKKLDLEWSQQAKEIETLNRNKIPKIFLDTIATNSASVSFSYDENKIMYIQDDRYQVYDIEKEINYQIGDANNILTPFWLPKSNSIIYINSNKIKSIEFDGTNNNTIFSSDTKIKLLIPQFDGEKLIIWLDKLYSLTIR